MSTGMPSLFGGCAALAFALALGDVGSFDCLCGDGADVFALWQ